MSNICHLFGISMNCFRETFKLLLILLARKNVLEPPQKHICALQMKANKENVKINAFIYNDFPCNQNVERKTNTHECHTSEA